jgi:bifunctional ADP-heptose synthase (sugar kinase/adenylyltransferase)
MSVNKLSASRARQILSAAQKTRVLVVGDVMLDQFIWGGVSRISPEAPVPVVDFNRESFMPGGAANVARNLVSLETPAELFGAIGNDDAARKTVKTFGRTKHRLHRPREKFRAAHEHQDAHRRASAAGRAH